jgi:hypothetical protein
VDPVVARKTWRTLEPYHGVVYFAPEPHEEFKKLGISDRMMGYFGSRAAPMGAVPAEVVIATFFNFHPKLVSDRVPAVWDIASPQALLDARLRGADAMLRRVLSDAVDSDELIEAAALARRAAESCKPEGRPLYAGHASVPWPDEPHLVLWHAISCLREFRGDGHIAAMTVEGLDGPARTPGLGSSERGRVRSAPRIGSSIQQGDRRIGRVRLTLSYPAASAPGRYDYVRSH